MPNVLNINGNIMNIMEEIGYAIVLLVRRHSSGAVTRNVTLPCPEYVIGAIKTKYHTIGDETSTDYIDILKGQSILLLLIRIFCYPNESENVGPYQLRQSPTILNTTCAPG